MVTVPVCQSCAMPMESSEQFGTEADGSQSQEFCTHCYQQGSYTAPDSSFDEMVDIVVRFIDLPEVEAREVARENLSGLKRWQD